MSSGLKCLPPHVDVRSFDWGLKCLPPYAAGSQIEDAINNGTIKNEDAPKFKKNFGSSSKIAEV